MIKLMVKQICENSEKINVIAKHINKLNNKHCLEMIVGALALCSITSKIEKQEQKIMELETELKEMKSKGE